MMPPPHINNNNRNRVENIKKKFEDINKFVPVSGNLNNSRPNLVQKSRLGRSEDPVNSESKCLSDSPKKQKLASDLDNCSESHNNSETPSKTNSAGHPLLERQLSSPTSRAGHIKRSPAFRCDRIVKGRNVLTPSVAPLLERQRSVVDKRVKQFDSSSVTDLVSAKPCNAVLAEQRSPTRDSQNNVSERTRAFTSPTDRFHRPPKFQFDTENGGPGGVKRNRLEHSEDSSFVKNINVVNRAGGWLHKQDNDTEVSLHEVSNGNAQNHGGHSRTGESASARNLFSEVRLKKVGKDLNVHSSAVPRKSPSTNSPTVKSPTSAKYVSSDRVHAHPISLSSSDNSPRRVEYQPGLTDTLKAALKAPLPTGPPPKKPPRTFAHGSPVIPNEKSNSRNLKNGAVSSSQFNLQANVSSPPPVSVVKPVRSKTESQIMLRKLENALLSHKGPATSPVTSPVSGKEHLSSPENSPPKCTEAVSQDQPSSNIRGGGLSSLNCVSGPSVNTCCRDSICEKQNVPIAEILHDSVMKRKSSLQDARSDVRLKIQGALHKSHSEEHIYAEPFQFMGESSQVCTSKTCEANFRPPIVSRENAKSKFNPKRILSTSPEQIFRARIPVALDSSPEGLHYLCTPIQENSPTSLGELHMSSLPGTLRLSPPTEASNPEVSRRECLSLDVQQPHFATPVTPRPKLALKRSSGEKSDKLDKAAKECSDSNLNSTKIKFLMNQAYGSPLQCLPATPMDSNSDSDSIASTPDEGVSLAHFPGVPSPPNQLHSKEIIRPSCPPPDIPETPSKESLQQLTAERRTYVRRVSSHVMGRRSLRLAPPQTSNNHLFECLLLVGLNLDPDRPKCKVPYIKSKFPPEADVPPHMEDLCFPDAGEWPPPALPKTSPAAYPGEEQCYSLVITNDTGERKYGYCRRVQPEGAPICLPLAYCILSTIRASGFYFKVLAELEMRHGEPEIQQAEFIQRLYSSAFPNPGEGLCVNNSGQELSIGCTGTSSTGSSGSGSIGSGKHIVIKRLYDTRLEERDMTRLFNSLPIPILLQVFGSLLLERKVLLLSNSISKLSSCVEALQSILFPFVWQHTFIPVLPTSMLDVCQAPTPYIIGVLKGKHPLLPPVTIDDGIMVDLDNALILQSQKDETTILPSGISRSLRVALQLVQSSTLTHDASRNVLVSEAFLRLFVEVCGHYLTHIVVQQDGKRVFERESFIKASRSRSIQMFLEWFTETAMFSAFIESRLGKASESKGIFEQRAAEHFEDREKNTLLYLKNYKCINKKVKTLGDRFKDWTPFS